MAALSSPRINIFLTFTNSFAIMYIHQFVMSIYDFLPIIIFITCTVQYCASHHLSKYKKNGKIYFGECVVCRLNALPTTFTRDKSRPKTFLVI